MGLTQLLFDLDNTLYDASSGLFGEIARRMTDFVARYLSVDHDTAQRRRRIFAEKYGTTLGGLIAECGFDDPEAFMDFVHPQNVGDYIERNPGLRKMLDELPIEKSIFTNSPLEHAQRVLGHLDIRRCFGAVFDIRFCSYMGKPVPTSYQSVLAALGKTPAETLLIDDVPQYLAPFAAMGGAVLLVDGNDGGSAGFPAIRKINELPGHLEKSRFAFIQGPS